MTNLLANPTMEFTWYLTMPQFNLTYGQEDRASKYPVDGQRRVISTSHGDLATFGVTFPVTWLTGIYSNHDT
jgi:hypothetical protein